MTAAPVKRSSDVLVELNQGCGGRLANVSS